MEPPKKLKFKQKYKEGQFLGQGKAGKVYKVQRKIRASIDATSTSSSLKKSCEPEFFAAKHISLSKIDLQAARKQLTILQQLKHMYIVRVYEDFVEDDELIIIMDYCEGKDLQFLIQQMKKKGKFFNESLVSTWIFQLILVVEYIHSCNIIHRDIKPQNVFVDKDMNLKIGDFGVSRHLQGSENCQTTAGTPLYFSPEVINGEPYSKRTDIWSLGCVIYQICTLEKPFMAKSGFIQLINVIKTTEPKNIPKIYSSDLNKLIRKMLTKDPKKRPTSRQLLQDPILVQLMINYSSQVNLKEQYEKKPIQKPTLTESFIELQSNAVNERLMKFQQQLKAKMENLKNKKVKTTEVDKYYADIQSKMKNLQKVVDIAFKQLKGKSQPEDPDSVSKIKSTNQSQVTKNKRIENNSSIKNNNSSALSESDVTIKSVNLGTSSRMDKSDKKQMQNNILNFDESSSMDSVSSIFLQSNKNIAKQMSESIKNSKLQKSDKFDKSSRLMLKKQAPQQLQATLKSQFVETIKSAQDPNKVRDCAITHIQEVSKQIQNNPNLIFDQNFLNVTLSLSNNDLIIKQAAISMKKKNVQGQVNFDKSYSSSGRTINFEFSKKDYQQTLLSASSKKAISESIKSEGEKDSLEEYYEQDFDSYEEDKELDVREQQKKSVKDLFASTLKNFTMVKNDSNNNSSYSNPSINPRNKYSMTLSTIREQSSEGGSTISYNDDFER